MKQVTYDSEADAWYLRFSDNKVSQTIPLNEKIICDLDSNWLIVWIEFIWVKKEYFL